MKFYCNNILLDNVLLKKIILLALEVSVGEKLEQLEKELRRTLSVKEAVSCAYYLRI